MSYVYKVYAKRDEHHFLEEYLEDYIRDTFTASFFIVGLLGVAANLILLAVFYTFYTSMRLATRFWVNITVSMLLSSVVCMLRAVGDRWEPLSNTETMCKFRVYVPTALDITCFGNIIMMCLDRLTVVHFPSLYIYNVKNDNCKIMYGWTFGLLYFIVKMFGAEMRTLPARCVTPYSLAFPLETVSTFAIWGLEALFLVVVLGYVFTPVVTTSMQQTWVDLEVKETVRVIWLALATLLLCLPKYILIAIYFTHGYADFEYQVMMTILHLPTRLVVFLPLIILIRKDDFKRATYNVVAVVGDRNKLKTEIAAEEAKADFILRSVMMSMYPNHPSFLEPRESYISRGSFESTPASRHPGSVASRKRLSVVTFDTVKYKAITEGTSID